MENMAVYLENISLLSFIIVFAAGVATSFTPCVYPLIPIVAGVIGTTKEGSKSRKFLLSLSYVSGMAVTFSILGMFAALTGRLFGQVQTNPTAHLILGALIIIFALALLDVVQLPTFLLTRAGAGKIAKGGGFLSVFLMGFASGFVAAPCTTAVIGALLAYVASTQNVVAGFFLLFSFAMGLGVLLVIVGTFSGILASLPRSEKWMSVMTRIMAFAMMVLGCFFIYKAGTLSI